MREDEEGLLDALPQAADTSRLSCQIIWDSDLDGLELTLVGDGA
jgi:ferredoxin